MLKMYQSGEDKGSQPELWEANWEKTDFDRVLSFCESDPLFPLFERYAVPGIAMLEGGCGVGQYVAYYSSRGANVVGLDFARETLVSLHKRLPGLKLCAGDVAALPFCNHAFDLYYSGGVVEHFEEGPEHALLEARRVLRPGGVLLVSVPYLSPLRRVLFPFKSRSWKRVSRALTDPDQNGLRFFQYVYSQQEFDAILSRAGLRVIETRGYGILWGLYDLAFVETLIAKLTGGHLAANGTLGQAVPDSAVAEVASERAATPDSTNRRQSNIKKLIKRLIVNEDERVPVAGLVVRLMRRVCANMMMYVCERN